MNAPFNNILPQGKVGAIHFPVWKGVLYDKNGELTESAEGVLQTASKFNIDVMMPIMVFAEEKNIDNFISDENYSTNPEDIKRFILEAKSRNIETTLIPHTVLVENNNSQKTYHPDFWRGEIIPNNPEIWMNNYLDSIFPYLKASAEAGSEEFVVFSEMNKALQAMQKEGLIDEFFEKLEARITEENIDIDISVQLHLGEGLEVIQELSSIEIIKKSTS